MPGHGPLSGHPHIVTVHRGGTTELGEPYIVMDLMDAGSLADRLAGEGALPWPEVLEIGVAVAGALETAHRAGILHLDVKPANVLMSRYGEPQARRFRHLPDAGGHRDHRRPGRGPASPSPHPERLLDGTAMPASDLYALGATLYTLLAGEPAFATKPGEDLLVAIARIVREPVPDLRMHGVPDPLALVVERLMAKSPLDRFATASDAAFALQAAQRATGRPVTKAVVEGAAGTARGHRDLGDAAPGPVGARGLRTDRRPAGPGRRTCRRPARPAAVTRRPRAATLGRTGRCRCPTPPLGPWSSSRRTGCRSTGRTRWHPTAPTLRAPIAPGAREPHPARRSRRPLVLALAVAGRADRGCGRRRAAGEPHVRGAPGAGPRVHAGRGHHHPTRPDHRGTDRRLTDRRAADQPADHGGR